MISTGRHPDKLMSPVVEQSRCAVLGILGRHKQHCTSANDGGSTAKSVKVYRFKGDHIKLEMFGCARSKGAESDREAGMERIVNPHRSGSGSGRPPQSASG